MERTWAGHVLVVVALFGLTACSSSGSGPKRVGGPWEKNYRPASTVTYPDSGAAFIMETPVAELKTPPVPGAVIIGYSDFPSDGIPTDDTKLRRHAAAIGAHTVTVAYDPMGTKEVTTTTPVHSTHRAFVGPVNPSAGGGRFVTGNSTTYVPKTETVQMYAVHAVYWRHPEPAK